MKINIYGSRGSIARCHPSLHRYGGNTSCIELECSGTRIVLDMGSGAYDLGQKLVKMGPLKNQHVLLSHSHWDHIQGFPFFAPLFIPGSEWNIYAPGGFSSTLKDKLSSQMSHEFFPLSLEELGADINYHDLKEGQLDLGDVHVTTQYINHTVLTLGYRLQSKSQGTSMAYITDHEMFNPALADGYKAPAQGTKLTPDDRHAEFFRNVDLLVHDTQYLASEYEKKKGWGHATVEYVVDMAMAVNVKKLALFHHDPLRTDDQIDEIVALARERVRAAGGSLEVFAAADFSTLELERDPNASLLLPEGKALHESWTCAMQPGVLRERPKTTALTAVVDTNLEIVVSHAQQDLYEGLESDGFQVTHIAKGRPFLQSVPHKKPSMIVVNYETKQKDDYVLKNCQRLREGYGSWGKEVPYIVVVKDHEILEDLRERGEMAGITDWVVEPCSPAYIRTRIRMGISRNPCKWKPPPKPKNEKARIRALESIQILDSSPEDRFDRITKLCATIFAVPLVFITLVDENRQWFKSAQWQCPGMPPEAPKPAETSREVSFCGHAILQNEPLIIPDATQDDRFAQNPFVADGLQVRFYAGVPIAIPNAHDPYGPQYNIGTLCIIDQRPRDLDDNQRTLLMEFAELVKTEILTYASRKLNPNGQLPYLKSKLTPANPRSSSSSATTTASTVTRAA